MLDNFQIIYFQTNAVLVCERDLFQGHYKISQTPNIWTVCIHVCH